MNRKQIGISTVLALAMVGGLAMAREIAPSPGDTIAVLAVADVRKDKRVKFGKLDQICHRTIRRGLKKSTYDLAFQTGFGGVSEVTEEDLDYADPSWVGQLGPEDERWVLLIVLEDAVRKTTFGSAFGTVCSGYLFDKSTGESVWIEEASGTRGQGGLIGFAMGSAMRGEAFASCASALISSFPGRLQRKKRTH